MTREDLIQLLFEKFTYQELMTTLPFFLLACEAPKISIEESISIVCATRERKERCFT